MVMRGTYSEVPGAAGGRKTHAFSRRLRAYELFAGGTGKSAIALELGVSRAAVSQWCKMDRWDERLAGTIEQAEQAVEFRIGDQVAKALAELRNKLGLRIRELEALCHSGDSRVQLAAIREWLRLAGVKQALPNPALPASTPRSLELIQDLVAEGTPAGVPKDEGQEENVGNH